MERIDEKGFFLTVVERRTLFCYIRNSDCILEGLRSLLGTIKIFGRK